MWQGIEWSALLGLSAPVGEIVLRGSVVYWVLFLIFRFMLRRDVGNVGIMDFLLVVIIADASQNAMTGEAKSIADGLLLIATLVGWNYGMDVLSYKSPRFRAFTEARSLMLFQHGKIQWRNLRREFITKEELFAKLRECGLEDFSKVKEMRLESDGEISVIPHAQ